MLISVTFTLGQLESRDVETAAVVVIDCFRASTSMATALAAGASRIYPFADVGQALAERRKRPGALLAGERNAARIEGFDLGNSPSEFTERKVSGREIIMTTTNGTGILTAASRAARVLVGAFVNLKATVEALCGFEGEVIFAAAGTQGRLAVEDAICAGLMARGLHSANGATLDDTATLAFLAAQAPWERLQEAAIGGRGAANVRRAGLESDLRDCLRLDAVPVVVEASRRPLTVFSA